MNNKGISLIALVILIVVMIIIATIAMNSGTSSYDNALDAKAKEERNQMIHAVQSRFGDYQINSIMKPLIGEVIPDEYLIQPTEDEIVESCYDYLYKLFITENRLQTEDEIKNKTLQTQIRKFLEDNVKDMDYTRIIRHRDAIELGLESVSLDTVFLVNYYSIDVVGPIQ